jgi:Trypsin-like peptidase domain/Tetratricopeptide repeat
MMKIHSKIVAFLSLLTSLSTLPQTAIALQPEAVYQKANSAVVFIVVPQNRKQAIYGSGIIINPKGWIITVNHIVKNRQNVIIKVADYGYYGTVVARDLSSDLALIKLQSQMLMPTVGLQAIPPRIGQKIFVIGNPLTLEKSFSDGLVSRLTDNGWIQYTAPTNPGNSGSPLLNEDGDVLGIVQSRAPDNTPGTFASGIYFAVSASKIQNFLATVRHVPISIKQESTYIANGLVQMRKGNYRQAIENYNQAIQLNYYSSAAYLNRAYIQTLLKNNQLALEDYTRAIQSSNHSTSGAYWGRGRVYTVFKDYKNAIKDFDSAIHLNTGWGNSSLAAVHYGRGAVQALLKNKKAAIADFKMAADLYLKQGRTAEYQRSLNQIIRLKAE